MEYEVYDRFHVRPDDISVFEQNDKETRQVTLITCTTSMADRFIVRLREI